MEKRFVNETEDVKEIDILEVAAFIQHWLWLIVAVGLIFAAITFAVSAFVIKPIYVSTTKIYILSKNDQNDNLTYADTQLSTLLAKDFQELIKSRYVLETIIDKLELDEDYEDLAKKITVSNTKDTRIISISVEDDNPRRAQYLANAVREVAAIHIRNVMDIEAVNIVDEANLPILPTKPEKKKVTAIGFLIGAACITGILVLRYYFDDSIKSSEDVEKYMDLTTLSMIPIMNLDDKEITTTTKKK